MDSTVQLFEFMGVNRSLFVQWVLIGTLTSLVVVYVAHTFRNLPTPVRAGNGIVNNRNHFNIYL